MKKIEISKTNQTWFANYVEKVITNKSSVSPLNDEFYWRIVESVESDHFQGLLIAIGEKKWVDEINKNE